MRLLPPSIENDSHSLEQCMLFSEKYQSLLLKNEKKINKNSKKEQNL